MNPVRPTLVFTWGNPSRGDDAIGPRIFELLTARGLAGIDLLTDFQLQVEHAVDLEQRQRVLFVDASVSAPAPFTFHPLAPVEDVSYSTHAMSPASLLAVYQRVYGREPPPSFMLSITGYDFELGKPLSEAASHNIAMAMDFIIDLNSMEDTRRWIELCSTSVAAEGC